MASQDNSIKREIVPPRLPQPQGKSAPGSRELLDYQLFREDLAISLKKIGFRPSLDWEACLTDPAAGDRFRQEYLEAFIRTEKK